MDYRQASIHQHLTQQLHVPLVLPSQRAAFFALQDLNGLAGTGEQHGREGGSENKAGGIGTDGVN